MFPGGVFDITTKYNTVIINDYMLLHLLGNLFLLVVLLLQVVPRVLQVLDIQVLLALLQCLLLPIRMMQVCTYLSGHATFLTQL